MNISYGIAAPMGARSEEELKRLQAMLRPRAATGVWSQEDQSAYDAYLKKEAADPLSYRVYGYEPPAMVSNRARVESMQDILGVKVDGLWGPQTQAAYDARRQEEAALRTQQARGERGLVPLQGGVDDGYVSSVPDGPMIPNRVYAERDEAAALARQYRGTLGSTTLQGGIDDNYVSTVPEGPVTPNRVKAGDTPTLVEKVYQGLLGVAQQKSGEAGRMAMMERKTGAKEGESAVDSGKAAGYTGYSPYSNFQKYYDYGLAEEYLQNIPDEPEETEPVVPPRRIGGRPVKWTVENGKRVEVSKENNDEGGKNQRAREIAYWQDDRPHYAQFDLALKAASSRLNRLTFEKNHEACVNLYCQWTPNGKYFFFGDVYEGNVADVVVPSLSDLLVERERTTGLGRKGYVTYAGYLHSHPYGGANEFSTADKWLKLLYGNIYLTTPDGKIYRTYLGDSVTKAGKGPSAYQLPIKNDDLTEMSQWNTITHESFGDYLLQVLIRLAELKYGASIGNKKR